MHAGSKSNCFVTTVTAPLETVAQPDASPPPDLSGDDVGELDDEQPTAIPATSTSPVAADKTRRVNDFV